jgi:hypothetical protein
MYYSTSAITLVSTADTPKLLSQSTHYAAKLRLRNAQSIQFNQESESLQSEVAITNDTSEHTSAADSSDPASVFFTTIQGRLKTAHSNPPHLNWDQWHAVYRGQPWLAIQAQHITAMKVYMYTYAVACTAYNKHYQACVTCVQ